MEAFAYKFSIIGWILGDFISVIITASLWIAVYKNSSTQVINGFDLPTMLVYLITIKVVSHLVYSSNSFWNVGEDIREGNIALQLIRPISYRNRLLAADIGSYLGSFIISFLPIFIVGIVLLIFVFNINIITWYGVILFIISSFLALVLYSIFNFVIGQLAFFTGSLFGIFMIKQEFFFFLAGGLIPLSFFPSWARTILNFLPFQSLLETPTFIMMNMIEPLEILKRMGLQVLWIIIFLILSTLCFRTAVKHLSSNGG